MQKVKDYKANLALRIQKVIYRKLEISIYRRMHILMREYRNSSGRGGKLNNLSREMPSQLSFNM